MAFDISTAQPEQEVQTANQAPVGFDISTAQPDVTTESTTLDPQPTLEPETTIGDIGRAAGGLGMEAVAGANRAIFGAVDMFTTDPINSIRALFGADAIPTLKAALGVPKGQFTEGTKAEGLPTDIAAGAGEFAIQAATGQGLLKQAAKQFAPSAAGTGAQVLRAAAKPSLPAAAGFGAASGAGSEVGEDISGSTGALVGAVVAPVAGIAAIGGAKAVIANIAKKFSKTTGLIDPATSLPLPAFQKALDKKGLTFGSIVDDVDSLPILKRGVSPDDVVDQILKRKLITGAGDDVTATLRLEGSKIVPDILGEEAVKQGFKPGHVAAAKLINKNTTQEALKMLSMTRQILANASKTDEFRPTDIVGNNVMERVSFIRARADTLRKQLNNIANKSSVSEKALGGPGVVPGLKGLKINTTIIEDAVMGGLEKLKINIPTEILRDTGKLNAFLKSNEAFVGSLISENPSSKNIIRKSIKLLSEPGKADASRAHDLKRQLDEMIDFNKASKQGLTESGRSFAKLLRRSLNQAIREVSPKYAKINDELSSSIEAMTNFQKIMGPSIDVFDKSAAKSVGQDLRGLLSNRKSRVRLENVINNIDDVAQQMGGNFDVNVKNLVRFANTLDERFGAIADTSFKGEITGALNQAARGTTGIKDLIASKAIQQAEKLRGINDKNALNALTKLLKRNKL